MISIEGATLPEDSVDSEGASGSETAGVASDSSSGRKVTDGPWTTSTTSADVEVRLPAVDSVIALRNLKKTLEYVIMFFSCRTFSWSLELSKSKLESTNTNKKNWNPNVSVRV
jgi:hypothetical protein